MYLLQKIEWKLCSYFIIPTRKLICFDKNLQYDVKSMFTKVKVSLKLHCLDWQGTFVYNNSIQMKSMLFIISLSFVVYF